MVASDLVRAALRGDVDEVRRLVGSEGVDTVAAVSHSSSDDLQEALHSASGNGHLPVACYLVEEVGVAADKEDVEGWTGLHYAACSGRLPVVQYLVETGGANVAARTITGSTPLHLASSHGYEDVVKYLVEEQQANVNAKNNYGDTPLDCTWFNKEAELVFRYLLPRAPYISEETLRKMWKRDSLVDTRGIMLEKYALGRGLANAFRSLPIHTVFAHFRLLSDKAFQDAIKLFPSSVFSLVDTQGRLSMHVALASQDAEIKSPLVISTLFERDQRSALARDPTTGLYPHETVAIVVSEIDNVYENGCLNLFAAMLRPTLRNAWVDLIYKMFRSNPQPFIQCRLGIGKRASLPDTGCG